MNQETITLFLDFARTAKSTLKGSEAENSVSRESLITEAKKTKLDVAPVSAEKSDGYVKQIYSMWDTVKKSRLLGETN